MSEKRTAARGQPGGIGGTDNGGNHRLQLHSSTPARDIQLPAHGRLSGDVWTKELSGSRHMLRTPPAWSVDAADLDAAEHAGARLVCIRDLEQLRSYWAHVATIRRRGFRLDRKAGEQVGLALADWRATRAQAEAHAQELTTDEPAELEPLVVQERLW
jgi:hypothetical protein